MARAQPRHTRLFEAIHGKECLEGQRVGRHPPTLFFAQPLPRVVFLGILPSEQVVTNWWRMCADSVAELLFEWVKIGGEMGHG